MAKNKKKKLEGQKNKKGNSSPVCFAKAEEVRSEFLKDEKQSS